MTKLREVMASLNVPKFKVTIVSPNLGEKERVQLSNENAKLRLQYINTELSARFPEVASVLAGKLTAENTLILWRQSLTDPDDRLVLEAARSRAIFHEQRPADFVALDLNDLDYYETEESINTLKSENKQIELFLNSHEFKSLPKEGRRLELKRLFKERDEKLHDLIFILTLNVDDLPKSEMRKLNAMHAIGNHNEAKEIARDSVFALRRKAVAEYRKAKENQEKLIRTNYRTFS